MNPPQDSDKEFDTQAASRAKRLINPDNLIAAGSILAGSTILLGGGAIVAHELSSPSPEQSHIAEVGEATTADKAAFDKLIDEAETKNYDESLVIGDPMRVQPDDSNLQFHGIARALMDPDYAKDKDAGFEGIKESTTVIGITQPDQIFDVIGVDLNNDRKKEFFVVPDSQIIHHNDGTVPAPIQSHDLPDVPGGDGSGD
jgi:hypothetical protein